jgi:hypothetical protein
MTRSLICLKNIRIPVTVAMKNCINKLPVPGSRYKKVTIILIFGLKEMS